jgi:hypothetical protein
MCKRNGVGLVERGYGTLQGLPEKIEDARSVVVHSTKANSGSPNNYLHFMIKI